MSLPVSGSRTHLEKTELVWWGFIPWLSSLCGMEASELLSLFHSFSFVVGKTGTTDSTFISGLSYGVVTICATRLAHVWVHGRKLETRLVAVSGVGGMFSAWSWRCVRGGGGSFCGLTLTGRTALEVGFEEHTGVRRSGTAAWTYRNGATHISELS